MLNAVTLGYLKIVANLQEKTRKFLRTIRGFMEAHKPLLRNCAVTYISVKVGLILLVTFATMVLLTTLVSRHLAIEMSNGNAILFASPLTLIVMFKLYFIFKVLMTYNKSRLMIKSAISVMLLKGRQGIQRMGETFPVDLSPLSLKKVRNR